MAYCVDVPDPATGMNDSVIEFELPLFTVCAFELFHGPGLIIRVNALKECFESWLPTVRVKPQHAVAFLGPVADLFGSPCPTACVAQPLRFHQITLAPPQGIFGAVAFLDVDSGSVPTNNVSQLVAQGHVADQQPAIIPIHSPQPCFTLHRFHSRHGALPLADEPREVIGMN